MSDFDPVHFSVLVFDVKCIAQSMDGSAVGFFFRAFSFHQVIDEISQMYLQFIQVVVRKNVPALCGASPGRYRLFEIKHSSHAICGRRPQSWAKTA